MLQWIVAFFLGLFCIGWTAVVSASVYQIIKSTLLHSKKDSSLANTKYNQRVAGQF